MFEDGVNSQARGWGSKSYAGPRMGPHVKTTWLLVPRWVVFGGWKPPNRFVS